MKKYIHFMRAFATNFSLCERKRDREEKKWLLRISETLIHFTSVRRIKLNTSLFSAILMKRRYSWQCQFNYSRMEETLYFFSHLENSLLTRNVFILTVIKKVASNMLSAEREKGEKSYNFFSSFIDFFWGFSFILLETFR